MQGLKQINIFKHVTYLLILIQTSVTTEVLDYFSPRQQAASKLSYFLPSQNSRLPVLSNHLILGHAILFRVYMLYFLLQV